MANMNQYSVPSTPALMGLAGLDTVPMPGGSGRSPAIPGARSAALAALAGQQQDGLQRPGRDPYMPGAEVGPVTQALTVQGEEDGMVGPVLRTAPGPNLFDIYPQNPDGSFSQPTAPVGQEPAPEMVGRFQVGPDGTLLIPSGPSAQEEERESPFIPSGPGGRRWVPTDDPNVFRQFVAPPGDILSAVVRSVTGRDEGWVNVDVQAEAERLGLPPEEVAWAHGIPWTPQQSRPQGGVTTQPPPSPEATPVTTAPQTQAMPTAPQAAPSQRPSALAAIGGTPPVPQQKPEPPAGQAAVPEESGAPEWALPLLMASLGTMGAAAQPGATTMGALANGGQAFVNAMLQDKANKRQDAKDRWARSVEDRRLGMSQQQLAEQQRANQAREAYQRQALGARSAQAPTGLTAAQRADILMNIEKQANDAANQLGVTDRDAAYREAKQRLLLQMAPFLGLPTQAPIPSQQDVITAIAKGDMTEDQGLSLLNGS